VQGTFDQLMRYIGEKPSEVAFTCAGINHMAFYLSLAKDGKDLYPRLFAAMNDPKIYGSNKVRFEIMRRLGHFVTESSEHNAEYCPWFIPHGKERISAFDVPIDEYLRRCDGIVDEFERLKTFARGPEAMREVCASHEYCSTIINSMTTGTPSVIYGNLVNGGTISNLPRTAIVEAPTLVDRTGLHHAQVGELPPQLVGYMQPHVTQHELFIRAATEGRRDHVYQACLFDPLTAATLSTDQVVEMCDEMIAAYGDQLPALTAPTLVPTSGKQFPRVDASVLRASWDRAQRDAVKDMLGTWHVIGAFPSPKPDEVSLDTPTPVDADIAARGDGSVDLAKTYQAVATAAAAGGSRHAATKPTTVGWRKAEADKRGFVSFDAAVGRVEWAVGYAYCEVEEIHGREVELGIGSDDGIRIWVNGVVVHEHEVARGYTAGSDRCTVRLKAGTNRILVKLDNYKAGWGFGISLPKPTH
jgi:hypothetical protein